MKGGLYGSSVENDDRPSGVFGDDGSAKGSLSISNDGRAEYERDSGSIECELNDDRDAKGSLSVAKDGRIAFETESRCIGCGSTKLPLHGEI